MPGKKSKKFIDKKGAVTFHLVHRSQRDPLQADADAPEHVLLAVNDAENDKIRKEEQTKYGILYEDDYDYMQHLRDADELNEVGPGTEVYRVVAKENKKKQAEKDIQIKLPSSVFGTDYETDVGLLNKAAPLRGPQLDWDPDIVAGLDEDFDFDNPDNLLDDDFICRANADQPTAEISEGQEVYRPEVEVLDSDEEDYPSDEADNECTDEEDNVSDIGSLGEQSFMSAETKTRFTNYSMTSSVMKRNDGLTLLDDRFEKLYEGYDDTDIGALDHEEIGGCIHENSEVLNSILDEFEEKQKQVKLKEVVEKGDEADIVSDTESSGDELIEVPQVKEKWDCESILSTYSNLYNHPKMISERTKTNSLKLTKKANIPLGVLPEKGPTLKQIENEEHKAMKGDTANTYRPKKESADERKQRKQAVKDEKRTRRQEKKDNKAAFKAEEIKQHKELLNVKRNFEGLKIV